MYSCPECGDDLYKVNSIINIHLTGDEKFMSLYKCSNCYKWFLIVSMEATIGPGTNYLKYRINLSEDEGTELKELMDKCSHEEECECPAHDYLDDFEKNNKDRRVILENETERWN